MAIAFRGLVFGGATNGNNVTLNLAAPSAGAAPQVNDLVLIVSSVFGRAGNEGRIGNALGYTQQDDQVNGVQRVRIAAKYFASGETGPVIEGSGNNADATGATAVWFSGVEQDGNFLSSGTQTTGSSTNPDPPSVTPAHNNCMVVVLAGSSAFDAAAGTITNYTTQATTQGNTDTNPASTAVAYRLLVGGSGVGENPAAFNAWTTGAWVASSYALKPWTAGRGTLAGSGSLSASTLVQSPAAATFGGAGGLSANVQQVSAPAAQVGQSESNIFVINYYWPSAPPQFRYLYVQAPALDVVTITAWSGQATFSGSGNLSASAKVGASAAATLQGSGSLSALATVNAAAAATLQGSGSLSVNATKSKDASATFVGAGGLSAYANLRMVVQATLQGSGSLTVEVTKAVNVWSGQATFAGSGSLSAAATLNATAAATLQGSGTLSADTQKSKQGAATFGGTGGLSVSANLQMVVRATLGGSGTLRVDGVIPGAAAQPDTYTSFLGTFTPTSYQLLLGLRQGGDVATTAWSAEARFVGSGSLSALSVAPVVVVDAPAESNIFVVNYYWPVAPLAARYNLYLQPARDVVAAGNVWVGEARFAGAGSLSARAQVGMAAAATFVGAGALSGNITSQGKAVLALLQGTGSLSALTAQQMAALAILNGAGSLQVDTAKSKDIAATFGGAGSLAAYANLRMVIAATLGGQGSLAVEAIIAGATNNWAGEARFNGTGGLTVTARLNEAAAATLQGAGSLAAFAGMRLGAAATFSGSGALSVDVQKLGKAIAATFSGTGGLSARAQVALSASANFGGVGTMSVVMRAAYAASVAFTGTGVMLTTVTQRNVAAAILAGTGDLSADVQRVIFGANVWPGQARFAGRGGLSADAVVVPFVPGPTYDYPIEHALDSDYGIRDAKRRRGRLVIGRR